MRNELLSPASVVLGTHSLLCRPGSCSSRKACRIRASAVSRLRERSVEFFDVHRRVSGASSAPPKIRPQDRLPEVSTTVKFEPSTWLWYCSNPIVTYILINLSGQAPANPIFQAAMFLGVVLLLQRPNDSCLYLRQSLASREFLGPMISFVTLEYHLCHVDATSSATRCGTCAA